MATISTTPATKSTIDYASPLTALLQLIPYLGGTKTTTGATTGTTGTTGTSLVTGGNIDPLLQIFAQQSSPEALQALVADLFNQGAMQVPGLTAQFANATGSRVANNQMLAQSLAMLNSDLAKALGTAVVQNQANASQTAGKIAEATKTQQQTQTQNQQQQTNQTQSATPNVSGGDLAKYGGAITLGGTLLNKLGKSDAFKDLFGMGGEATSPPAPVTLFPSVAPSVGSGNFDLPGIDLSPTYLPAPYAANAIDLGLSNSGPSAIVNAVSDIASGAGDFSGGGAGDFADLGGFFDFSSPTDYGSPADIAASYLDLPDTGGGIFDTVSNFFGSFFADGGTVRPQIRNIPDFGPIVRPQGQPALNYAPPIFQTPAVPMPTMPVQPTTTPVVPGLKRKPGVIPDTGPVEGSAPSPGTAPTAGIGIGGVGGTGLSVGQVAGLVANAVNANPIGIMVSMVVNAINEQVNNPEFAEENEGNFPPEVTMEDPFAPETVSDPFGTVTVGEEAPTPAPVGEVSTSFDTEAVVDANPGISPAEAIDATVASIESGVEGTAVGVGEGDVGGVGDSGAATDAGEGTAPDAGGDSGDAGDAGGDGFADGGSVGRRKLRIGRGSLDTEDISATVGEYVLPVDVVDYIGKDVLDELVALVHTPLRTGTHG